MDMTKLYDARDELDWDELTEAERYDECVERATQALQPFKGQVMTGETVEAITRTLNRLEAVIDMEKCGLRRDWAEALADGN
jgi:hypothetical protein